MTLSCLVNQFCTELGPAQPQLFFTYLCFSALFNIFKILKIVNMIKFHIYLLIQTIFYFNFQISHIQGKNATLTLVLLIQALLLPGGKLFVKPIPIIDSGIDRYRLYRFS